MSTFQRARSEEQRRVRRRAILDVAASMLTEMPVAEVSLNELSRRVGLAKSNVLRYFESREAVLLELLDSMTRTWLVELDGELAAAIDGTAPVTERGDQVAAVIARSITARPVLCDLVGAQAAVLERNVSPQVAAQYKRAATANVNTLAHLARACLPELDEHDAGRLAAGVVLVTGALWPHTHPSDAMLAAYQADPSLAVLRIDFTTTVREVLEVLIAGLLARAARLWGSSASHRSAPACYLRGHCGHSSPWWAITRLVDQAFLIHGRLWFTGEQFSAVDYGPRS